MATTDLADRVHLIELPLGGARTVNTTLVEGDPLTLVDTGVRSDESLAVLDRELGRRGYRIEDLEQIVITHPHHDHFGAAAELVRRSGARLVGDGVEVMRRFPDSFRPNALFRADLFEESGAPSDLAAAWRERYTALGATGEPVEATDAVEPGANVRMGGADWIALATPGHAATSISLYQADARLLISGDILLGNGASNVTLHAMDRPGRWLLDILASLELLGQLDVTTAYPGHGSLIGDARRAVDDRRARACRRLDQVSDLLREVPRTAYATSLALYPPAVAGASLGVSQALGYLEALVALGRATSDLKKGIREYGS